jgi:hypothetical protein
MIDTLTSSRHQHKLYTIDTIYGLGMDKYKLHVPVLALSSQEQGGLRNEEQLHSDREIHDAQYRRDTQILISPWDHF